MKRANSKKSIKSTSKAIQRSRLVKRTPVDKKTIEDLVAANRILYAQSVLDGYGHVSARHDTIPDRFWLSQSMAPGLVTAGDILEFDLSGEPVDGQGRPTYSERFIHSEIYRRRPDVKAIVHSHSPAVIPFGVTSVPLKPIFHMSGFLGTGVPIFEIREIAGDTDMLVRNPGLGAALALCLGNKSAALMRGHGSVVVGESLPRAVGRSVYLEMSARMQMQALLLSRGKKITYLDAAEVKASMPVQDYKRAWPLWRAKALAKAKAERR